MPKKQNHVFLTHSINANSLLMVLGTPVNMDVIANNTTDDFNKAGEAKSLNGFRSSHKQVLKK